MLRLTGDMEFTTGLHPSPSPDGAPALAICLTPPTLSRRPTAPSFPISPTHSAAHHASPPIPPSPPLGFRAISFPSATAHPGLPPPDPPISASLGRADTHPEQAKAVLSHHLGEGLSDFDEIPADEGVWGHLVGAWNGLWAGEGERGRVVIIEGGVQAQDVLPTKLPESPSFYLESSGSNNLLAPYVYRAEHLLAHILDSLPEVLKGFKDTFEMVGTKAAAALGHELSCLTALAESIPWVDKLRHSTKWDAITISGLRQVPHGSEEWEMGRKGVQAGLEAVNDHPQLPPLLVIILPSSHKTLSARSNPDLPARAASAPISAMTAPMCYTSNSTCSSSTTCSGRGVCALLRTNANGECWGCQCASGFGGVECQKADYTVPFVILIFSTVMLVILVVGSIALLTTVGETKLPSTLTLAVGPTKRD
ncbi:hypothetical protein EHS25_003255 [Saitozyma podzolica]|uniref:Vacuolar sorting protein Vps3844 C-terminal domain-containing protein n=1 Tax=Saitozyma podzolica TaxID=1890683 RepID=A0A427Y8B6_9TREE|nr:hypothetical protein EHS25_003255 [Saitozyma podzolica]